MEGVDHHVLKGKQKVQSALRTWGKELSFLESYLVLLGYHTEGHNKIQDHSKDQEFVMVKWLHKHNVYHVKQVNGNGAEEIVNCQQLQDLQRAHNGSDTSSEEEVGEIPSFSPKDRLKEDMPYQHIYATWSRGQPPTLVWSMIASMGKESSSGLRTLHQRVDHCPAYVIIESTNL